MSFTVLPLNYFWPSVGVLPRPPIGLPAAQPSPLPCAGHATFHSQTKEFFFFFFLFSYSPWHSHLDIGWVFSLTNSYDMHLVILAHLSLFWVVCHPNRTFSLKEFEREPQNRLSPSPHRQTIPSLTSDPWPTTHILAGYKWVVPKPCVCSTFM